MQRLLPFVLAAALLSGCASVTPAPMSSDSSLIVGQLRLDAGGMGTAPNGANGFLNTDVPAAAAMLLQNESTGLTYELRTSIPGGFFTLANAAPGTYKLVELWAQLGGTNSYFTLTSTFNKAPTFPVAPGRTANLGVTRWTFTFDLTRSVSTNAFTFNGDFPAVAAALLRTDPQAAWTGRPADQVTFSGDLSATPAVFALPPRGSAFDKILIP